MKVNKQTNSNMTFLHCVFFSNVSLNVLLEKSHSTIVRLVAFVWLFSAASFQMFPQITCLRIYKITLVACVDTVCFQMCIRLVYFLERCCGGMVYFLERCCLGMVLFLERCRVVESFSRNVRG